MRTTEELDQHTWVMAQGEESDDEGSEHKGDPAPPKSPLDVLTDILTSSNPKELHGFFSDKANLKALFDNANLIATALLKQLPEKQAVAIIHPFVTVQVNPHSDYSDEIQTTHDFLVKDFVTNFMGKHSAYPTLTALETYFMLLGNRECTKSGAGDANRKIRIGAFRLLLMLDIHLWRQAALSQNLILWAMQQAISYAVNLSPESTAMRKLRELCASYTIVLKTNDINPLLVAGAGGIAIVAPDSVAAAVADAGEVKEEKADDGPELERPENTLKDIYEVQVALLKMQPNAASAQQINKIVDLARYLGIDVQLPAEPGYNDSQAAEAKKEVVPEPREFNSAVATLTRQLQLAQPNQATIAAALEIIGKSLNSKQPLNHSWQLKISSCLEKLNLHQEQLYAVIQHLMQAIHKAKHTLIATHPGGDRHNMAASPLARIDIQNAWVFCDALYIHCIKKAGFGFLVQANSRIPAGLIPIHDSMLRRVQRKLHENPSEKLAETIAALFLLPMGDEISFRHLVANIEQTYIRYALNKFVECAPLHNHISITALADSCHSRELARQISHKQDLHRSLRFQSQPEITAFAEAFKTYLKFGKLFQRNILSICIFKMRDDGRLDDPENGMQAEAYERRFDRAMAQHFTADIKKTLKDYCNNIHQLILEKITSQQSAIHVYYGFTKISAEQAALELTRALLFYQFALFREAMPKEWLWKGEAGGHLIGVLLEKICKRITAEINVWYSQQAEGQGFTAGLTIHPVCPLLAGLVYASKEDNSDNAAVMKLLTSGQNHELSSYFLKARTEDIRKLFVNADQVAKQLIAILPIAYQAHNISNKIAQKSYKKYLEEAVSKFEEIKQQPAALFDGQNLRAFLHALHRYEIHKPDKDSASQAAREKRAAMLKIIMLSDMLFEDKKIDSRTRANMVVVLINSVTETPKQLDLIGSRLFTKKDSASSITKLAELGKSISATLQRDQAIWQQAAAPSAAAASCNPQQSAIEFDSQYDDGCHAGFGFEP